MVVFGLSFLGLMILPVNFSYWAFALLIAANGIGGGMFSAPNTSAMMNTVPAAQRGVASGMRATFQNSGTALSIGAFFTLMIAALSSTLGGTLTNGLIRRGVPRPAAHHIGTLPPVSSLFSAILGVNPLHHALSAAHALHALSSQNLQVITGRRFFPDVISGPFHHGLVVVFAVAAGLSLWPASPRSCAAPPPRRSVGPSSRTDC